MKTLEELQASDKAFFTPGDVCGILGTNPQTIRVTARQRPDLIGYEFTFVGNRMKIPKIPFLRYIGVDIDNTGVSEKLRKDTTSSEGATNRQILLAIAQQISELNECLDALEKSIREFADSDH